jgi:hypothetical protein
VLSRMPTNDGRPCFAANQGTPSDNLDLAPTAAHPTRATTPAAAPDAPGQPGPIAVEGDVAAFASALAGASAAGPSGTVMIVDSPGSTTPLNASCPDGGPLYIRLTVSPNSTATSACLQTINSGNTWFGTCTKGVALCPAAFFGNGTTSVVVKFWPCSPAQARRWEGFWAPELVLGGACVRRAAWPAGGIAAIRSA